MKPCYAVLLLLALGCSEVRAPVAPPDRFAWLALPGAAAGGSLSADAPVITVAGGEVRLDGDLVGEIAGIVATHRLSRIEGLMDALQARRQAWLAAHPDGRFPGVVVLAMAADIDAAVVKSVFQTAAFAGYPNAELVVRTPRGSAALRILAQVPTPTGPLGLSDTQIRAVVRAHQDALHACYLNNVHDAAYVGTVVTAWQIGASGAVTSAQIVSTTLSEATVEACLLQEIRHWTFPASNQATSVSAYPFRFGLTP